MQPSRFLRASLAILSLAGLLRFPAAAETLTDKQGRTLQAEIVAVEGDQVRIKRGDGQAFSLPLSSLSDDSRKTVQEWAKANADKLPADAIAVEMSRGKFDVTKTDKDVTLTTGEVVKNGMTLTEEKWGYAITISNKTTRRLENLRIEYRLFATVDSVHVKEKQGLKKKAYKTTLEPLSELGRVTFRTETISAIKSKYNGNIVSAKTGDSSSRETLSGIWLRVYRDKELLYETAAPGTLTTTETW